ncbi:MAG: aminotransferase class III-fold pyridoxal phosphate-dependent enzyme [Campylobacteraceae bacterium]|jgi:taurine--2-oxoglutarate transaminase|nr:aminotransferase class III-fold pyridoxal phosphate-dependent enzyme [Campylobacteraceae bacterium]
MGKGLKEEVLSDDLRYNLRPWVAQANQNPIAVSHAKGVFFWDYDGKRYFDMSSQLVNSNLGHSNEEINEAIKKQLDNFAYIAPAHAAYPRSNLAKKLVKKAPSNMAKVFFTCGGAESNDNAILIARAFSGKYKIFSSYRSYHGSTIGSGNLSGDARRFAAERPSAGGFIKFLTPYIYREKIKFKNEKDIAKYYLELLCDQIIAEDPNNIAAITLEAVAGTNGVIIPPKGYLEGVRKLCDEFNILLHIDEVMGGFGRTGRLFAFENFDIQPDIITFAKGITCGYVPLGGVIVSKEIADFYDTHQLLCGLTYNAHPLACAAGIAVLDYYDNHHIFKHVRKLGKVLKQTLASFEKKHKSVGDIRSIGLFAAVELTADKRAKKSLSDKIPYVVNLLRQRGFATIGRGSNIIIAPPLIITKEELLEALEILDEVLHIVDNEYEK